MSCKELIKQNGGTPVENQSEIEECGAVINQKTLEGKNAVVDILGMVILIWIVFAWIKKIRNVAATNRLQQAKAELYQEAKEHAEEKKRDKFVNNYLEEKAMTREQEMDKWIYEDAKKEARREQEESMIDRYLAKRRETREEYYERFREKEDRDSEFGDD